MVELDTEKPGGRLVLELLDRIFGELERLRIELADEHLAEVGVPDHAFLIDQDVMRLGGRPHHVVLGDDGAGVRPFGRGSVLSSYDQWSVELRLMVAR